nr:CRISPR-associated endonuclease Cas2 [Fusobacterium gastrosuis]
MNYLISYDIGNDKRRKAVSDFLIEKGFIRIQKSVFLGKNVYYKIKNMLEYIQNILNKDEDNLFCLSFNDFEYDNIVSFGNIYNYNIYNEYIIYI